jgi:hypothetical protein
MYMLERSRIAELASIVQTACSWLCDVEGSWIGTDQLSEQPE